MSQELPPDLVAAVALGDEMGRLFAEFDWAAHPLGPPANWPAEMRTTVATTLTSRFPIILWLGPQDLFTMYNEAYVPILGNRHPAALGERGEEVWWDIWDSIGPMIASVIDTGKAVWVDDMMLSVITAGRRQERWFTFSYGPLFGDNGVVYGVVATVAETTERVLSERRLHVLNAMASATMESRSVDDAVNGALSACAQQPADLPFVAVYVGDDTGEADTAEITLRGATGVVLPLLPRTLEELTDWDPAQRSRLETRLIEDVPSLIPGIVDVLGADHPEQALALPLGEGSMTGALVVGVNPRCPLNAQYRGFCQLLADRLSAAIASAVSYEHERQRGDALAELDRAKTAFLTNVSHEFRTPLTLLLGPLDDALEGAGPDALLTDRLGTARRNAQRLQRLVDSLLDFSRIEAGRATAKLVCTDVGALTSLIASSFSELCERAGLELIVNCDSVPAEVDPAMWETVMLNLLSNAVKFTMGGSITVEVHSESTECRITVCDTGVGVTKADLKRLGERFFRGENARGRSVEGTGIGLSVVQGLVELQHGTVQIASELGRGTTVTIRLPQSIDGTPVELRAAGPADSPYVVEADQWLASTADTESTDDGRELVLVADDNADMRAHLERVLSPHWRTVLVADGETALRRTRELRPAAIVTDVMMPLLDGFGLVTAIRADPDLAATPILMLSARAGVEAVSEGFAGGADDYLPKPFRSQELVERVAARLSAAARERAGRRSDELEAQIAAAHLQLDAALQAADSVTAIVDALVDSPLGSGGAKAVVLGVLDAEINSVRFEYGGAVPAELRSRYHLATLDTPLVPIDVIKTGEPMVITDTLRLGPRYRHVVDETAAEARSGVSQPLRGRDGGVIGSLGLLWGAPKDFDPTELETFARTAELVQSALDRVRVMEREHRIAVDFQEHLLDLDRGSTAAAVAACYQPAGKTMRVGGDWYLVAPLDLPGRVAISVGDVVGHGLHAATVMSRLRAAVAATALTDPDPGAVLATLDRYAATVPGARCATVSYGVIHTDVQTDGTDVARISYICAGHPYPLVVPPDGPPVFLQSGRRPPVAAWEGHDVHHVAEHDLPAGSWVLFYTDGLIERPGEPLDEGFARLRTAVAQCADLPVGDICDELIDRMAPPGGYTDDVVVLALRPCHTTARSFTVVLPTGLAHTIDARHQLRRWMRAIGIDRQRESEILLAIGEALTNAVEHGNREVPGQTVSIEAFVRGGTLAATVSDAGRWTGDSSFSQRSRKRGRGLTLIYGLTDHVDTVRTWQGTRVTLRFDHALGADRNLPEGTSSG
ncbi:SpoIIE family protein phosphatase [Mycobacterium numidiamassiliense]|uniref:SpoIIE family protein phosphatase n=1 Tax=Mycobacterium numidiamassiliense TaxID=1841861 RepID=UPI00097D9105|nr:SpoIIE family protein phosphatase [Mycobacterium numidiamassiliense]